MTVEGPGDASGREGSDDAPESPLPGGRGAADGPGAADGLGDEELEDDDEELEDDDVEEGDLDDDADEGLAVLPPGMPFGGDLAGLLGGSGLLGGAGMGDLGGLLSQLGRMRETVEEAQQAASTEVEGSAGGGAVRIRATAGMEFLSVTIDPAVLAEGDAEMLQDLVLASLRDLADRAAEVQQQALGELGGGGLEGFFGG